MPWEDVKLLKTLHAQPKQLDKIATFLPDAVERFNALVTDLAATATRYQVDKARVILRELVGQQVVLHPTSDGEERYLTAEMTGHYEGLTRLIFGRNKFGGGHPLPDLFKPTVRVPLRPVGSAKKRA